MGELVRYRVQRSQNGLRHGEVVEVDPREKAWADLIGRGILVEAAPTEETPDLSERARSNG